MNKYKDWLEERIKWQTDSLTNSANIKRYGGAFLSSIKVDVYKECLEEFEKLEKESEQGVSFDGLEIGKRYGIVTKDGSKRGAFTVVAKGCDDEGQYIWYCVAEEPIVSFKSYEDEYKSVEYFVEIKNGD